MRPFKNLAKPQLEKLSLLLLFTLVFVGGYSCNGSADNGAIILGRLLFVFGGFATLGYWLETKKATETEKLRKAAHLRHTQHIEVFYKWYAAMYFHKRDCLGKDAENCRPDSAEVASFWWSRVNLSTDSLISEQEWNVFPLPSFDTIDGSDGRAQLLRLNLASLIHEKDEEINRPCDIWPHS